MKFSWYLFNVQRSYAPVYEYFLYDKYLISEIVYLNSELDIPLSLQTHQRINSESP